jgi:hypothetical protein
LKARGNLYFPTSGKQPAAETVEADEMKKLAAILFVCGSLWQPVASVGAEYHRYYDQDRRDWHQWNDRENRAYRHWLMEEQRERKYRAYNRLRAERQREYWRWRHSHEDWR